MSVRFRPLAIFFLTFGFVLLVALEGVPIKVVGAACLIAGGLLVFKRRELEE